MFDFLSFLNKIAFILKIKRAECFCGNEYGKYGKASSKGFNCDMPCPNNPNEICGGPGANSIYLINWPSNIIFLNLLITNIV